MNGIRTAILCLLLCVPVTATLAAWLGTGRETLTKTTRYVQVEVEDPLFGDTTLETQAVHGPAWTFGRFVGLDALGGVAAATVLAAAAWWLIRRRRARRGNADGSRSNEHAVQT